MTPPVHQTKMFLKESGADRQRLVRGVVPWPKRFVSVVYGLELAIYDWRLMSSSSQKRLSKFHRDPKAVEGKNLTQRGLSIIATVARYRFLPTSLLVRLVEGNEDVTHRHLQLLYHRGLINRFAFPKTGGSNEFNYYLDETKALTLLADRGMTSKEDVDLEGVRNNKDKAYHKISVGDESGGRRLFLEHELMISRFHYMLELGCKKSDSQMELAAWRQGSVLHNTVVDTQTGEVRPHRPDAFFTLRFPNEEEGQNRSSFFYEADRKTTSIPKMMDKLRAHFEFIRQREHQEMYGIKRIRAVLIETLDIGWAEQLRQAAADICPVPLFWFTASEIFATVKSTQDKKGSSHLFLKRPEIILKELWLTTNKTTIGLAD